MPTTPQKSECCVCFSNFRPPTATTRLSCAHYYANVCTDCRLSHLAFQNDTRCMQCRWAPPVTHKNFEKFYEQENFALKFCHPDAESIMMAFLQDVLKKNTTRTKTYLADIKKMSVIVNTMVETARCLQKTSQVVAREFPHVFHYENTVGSDDKTGLLEVRVPENLNMKLGEENPENICVPSYAGVVEDLQCLRKVWGARITALAGMWNRENGQAVMRQFQSARYYEQATLEESIARLCLRTGAALQYWREKIVQCRLQEQKKRGRETEAGDAVLATNRARRARR